MRGSQCVEICSVWDLVPCSRFVINVFLKLDALIVEGVVFCKLLIIKVMCEVGLLREASGDKK